MRPPAGTWPACWIAASLPEPVVLAVVHNLPMRIALNAAAGADPVAGSVQALPHLAREQLTASDLRLNHRRPCDLASGCRCGCRAHPADRPRPASGASRSRSAPSTASSTAWRTRSVTVMIDPGNSG